MNRNSRTARKVGVTLAGAGLASALLAMALPMQSASADSPLASYSISVTPDKVKASTTNVETVVFTNANIPGSLDFANAASVSFPGFSNVSAPSSVTDSLGNTWTASVSGQTVSLSASGLGLIPGGTLTVPVTAKAPAATGDVTIPSSMSGLLTGVLGAFTNNSSSTTIGVFGDAVVCPAQSNCTSGTIGNVNQTSFTFVFHNTTGVSDAAFGRVEPGAGGHGCSAIRAYVGDSQNVINTNGTGSYTISARVDKSQVNATPNNGVGQLAYCAHTPVERTEADGTPAQLSTDGLYYSGIFPACNANRTLNCVDGNVHKNGAGDAIATIQVVGGSHDPGGVMGLLF